MSGVLAMLMGVTGPEPVVTLAADYNPTSTALDPEDASASFQLQSDGDIISGVSDAGDWLVPKSAAPSDYEAKITMTSGTLSSGTTGSWVALSSTRTWTLNRTTPGLSTAIGTLEIRKGSGPTLASSEITWDAEVTT